MIRAASPLIMCFVRVSADIGRVHWTGKDGHGIITNGSGVEVSFTGDPSQYTDEQMVSFNGVTVNGVLYVDAIVKDCGPGCMIQVSRFVVTLVFFFRGVLYYSADSPARADGFVIVLN